jgi:hypothetical protein
LVDGLFDVPALSIPSAAKDLGLTQRSVQLQVARLAKLGILHEATGRQRNRIFVAQGIADALTEEL